MKLLGRRVLIERDPIVEKVGSIIIPERARSKPQCGRVVAVGEGVESVKPGDIVFFGRYAHADIEGLGVVVKDVDLIAVSE